MGFPILGEDLDYMGIGLVAVGFEGAGHHPEAAIRHDGALQRRLGLKTHDDFILTIDVAGSVRGDGTWNLGYIEDPFLALLHEQFVQMVPDLPGALRGGGKEGSVSFVGFVVLLDEIANVDLLPPETRMKSLPGRNRLFLGGSTHISSPFSRRCQTLMQDR